MAFNYNGFAIADINISNIHGRTGIGVSRIGFSIDFRFPSTAPEGVTVRDVQVEVNSTFAPSSQSESYLGMAIPEVPFEHLVRPTNDRKHLLFWLTLNDGQLFELERMRGGRDVRFELKISALAYGKHGVWPQNDTIQRAVNLSEWATILTGMKGPDYLVIGVRMPNCAPDHPIASAIERLRHAHSSLVIGRYDAVVSDCRLALESALKATGERDELLKSVDLSKSAKRELSKRQRELVLLDSVRQYTHLAHHMDEDGRPEHYSRDDATMVLSTTAALVASSLARYDVSSMG